MGFLNRAGALLILGMILASACATTDVLPFMPSSTATRPLATATASRQPATSPTPKPSLTSVPTSSPARSTATLDVPTDCQNYTQIESLPGVVLRNLLCVAIAPDQSVWVGSDNDGAFHYDGKAWHQYTSTEGLADNSVHAFAFAADGTVWAATWFGAARFDGQQWRAFPFDQDFVGNDLHSLALHPDGSVWLGGGRGLLRLQDDQWEKAIPEVELSFQPAFAVAIDPEGGTWFGADQRALYHLQKGTLTPVGPPDPPEGLRINALLRTPEGALWVGTSHGLYRYQNGEWKIPAELLSAVFITSLAMAPDQTLWLGTYGKGIYRYDGQTWQRTGTKDGLVDSIIHGIAIAPDGAIWVTSPSGLGYLAP